MAGTDANFDPQAALRAELGRLKAKRAQIRDRDVASALDLRIQQIESELLPLAVTPTETSPSEEPKDEETPADEAPIVPPTPAQLRDADQLIRQAKVEKMRGNAKASTELLQKATEVAPTAPAVLEALADDMMERKRLADAKVVYQRALKIDPKNVGVETKLAHCALGMSLAGSIEDQLRRNLGDSPFIDGDDRTASLPSAIILSAILPGAGHLVLGQTQRGLAIMTAYLVAAICLLGFYGADVEKLLRFAGGGSGQPNMGVFLPLIVMAVIYVATLASLKGMADKVNRKSPTERPRPPVDLPFE